MTEHELTGEVMKLCDDLGLLYHHCPNSSRCQGPKGFPDLVIAGINGVIFAELKSQDGDTSAEQDRWLWHLARGGSLLTRVFLWRPADLTERRIHAWLHLIK